MLGMDATAVLATMAALTAQPAAPPAPAPEAARPAIPKGPARTVGTAIRRAQLTGAITWQQRVQWEEELKVARAAARRLPENRAREIRGVLRIAERLADRGQLQAERLTPVMKAVSATTTTFRLKPFPRPGQRLGFPGDGLVYEYRAGYGIQPHPLATAGRLNALAGTCLHTTPPRCRPAQLAMTAAALTDLGVESGGRLRLEYVFPFGRGEPPWSSSMAQATSAQALARAGMALEEPRYARAATGAYRALVSPATSVRRDGQVTRFAMYSFQPSMRVLNGELQTLVGLGDYARVSGSVSARRVLRRAAKRMRTQLPVWDTGAWTLYSAGGREATLHYHGLAATFARRVCLRRVAKGFCPAARRYARYTVEPPRLTVRAARVAKAGRTLRVQVRSSKLASGSVTVRGPRGVVLSQAVTAGRRTQTIRVVPRVRGRYRITLTGTAVNGRRDVARAAVKVKKRTAAEQRAYEARRRRAARRAQERRERAAKRAERERRERAQERERDAAEQRDGGDRPAD